MMHGQKIAGPLAFLLAVQKKAIWEQINGTKGATICHISLILRCRFLHTVTSLESGCVLQLMASNWDCQHPFLFRNHTRFSGPPTLQAPSAISRGTFSTCKAAAWALPSIRLRGSARQAATCFWPPAFSLTFHSKGFHVLGPSNQVNPCQGFCLRKEFRRCMKISIKMFITV